MSKYELPIKMAEDFCPLELNESYTEILKLDKLLSEAGIPHHIRRIYEGWQVIYYTDKGIVADAVQHNCSYGARQNLLEIMGLIMPEDYTCDSVKGWLTAENVFKRMSEHYKKYTESEGEG